MSRLVRDNWWKVIPGVVVVVVVITCDEYEASKPNFVFCASVVNVMYMPPPVETTLVVSLLLQRVASRLLAI